MLSVDTICDIIIFFIILFICIIVILVLKAFTSSDYPTTQIEDIDEDNLKTGDILIVGYKHIFGKIVRGFTSSIWTHSGVVWIDPTSNLPYVVELGIYKKKKKGLFKIPFDFWMKINKNQIKGILKYSGTQKICPYKFDEIFNKYTDIKLESFSYKWYKFLYRKYYSSSSSTSIRGRGGRGGGKIRQNFTCFEFTITLLQELGVYSKFYSSCSYFPGDIGNNNIKTNVGYSYENVKLIC